MVNLSSHLVSSLNSFTLASDALLCVKNLEVSEPKLDLIIRI